MCGATSAQTQLQTEEMQTLQQYDSMMQTQYANQQGLYKQVNSVLQPILAAGPDQKGFSQDEENTLNAQAVEGTAENYAGASKAVNESIAAEGGGNEAITTGGAAELKGEIAASAAQTESGQETQIQEANYQAGQQNFQNAEQGEMAVASGENPLGYAGAVTNQENATSNTANEIAQEDNSWINAAIGAAGSIGGAVVGENPGGIFGG
jgi:hypothetical protein